MNVVKYLYKWAVVLKLNSLVKLFTLFQFYCFIEDVIIWFSLHFSLGIVLPQQTNPVAAEIIDYNIGPSITISLVVGTCFAISFFSILSLYLSYTYSAPLAISLDRVSSEYYQLLAVVRRQRTRIPELEEILRNAGSS
jgi:hypothetical protein